jgi:hypothetical protein
VGEAHGQAIARVRVQQELDALSVLDLCAMNPGFEHKSLRVDQQVALSSFDLLGPVVTTLVPTHSRGLERLAIHYGRAGLRVSVEADSHTLAQGSMHPLPGAVQTPEAEVVVDGLPRRELVGQQSPGAATLQDVEDGVEDLAQGIYPRTATGFGSGKVGLKATPFGVR